MDIPADTGDAGIPDDDNVVDMMIMIMMIRMTYYDQLDYVPYEKLGEPFINEKGYFFICYLASPRPTLGHYRGDSVTHPMLITAFTYFYPNDPNFT